MMDPSTISDILKYTILGIVAAFAGGGILEAIYLCIFIAPNMSKIIQEKAIKVEAELDRGSVRSYSDENERYDSARYYYVVNGRRYKYNRRIVYNSDFEDTITLYYLPGEEKRATTRQFFKGVRKGCYWRCYLIAIPLCAILGKLLGW